MAGTATRTTRTTNDGKEDSPSDGKNKGALAKTTGKGGQQQLDEKMFRKVGFIEEDKGKEEKSKVTKSEQARNIEMMEFKERILEEVRKIRKERVEIEKVKVELEARASELEERMEVLEKKMQDWEVREREWVERQSVITENSVGEATAGGRMGFAVEPEKRNEREERRVAVG